jgi:plastocyanin
MSPIEPVEPSGAVGARRVRRAHRMAIAALTCLVGWVPAACSDDARTAERLEAVPVTTIAGPYTFDYTIPVGTASKIAVGIDPKVMPSELTATVGDTIRIVNEDTSSHTVGTFYVLAGTTLTYRFTKAGVFEGVCSTTPEETFLLTVLDD